MLSGAGGRAGAGVWASVRTGPVRASGEAKTESENACAAESFRNPEGVPWTDRESGKRRPEKRPRSGYPASSSRDLFSAFQENSLFPAPGQEDQGQALHEGDPSDDEKRQLPLRGPGSGFAPEGVFLSASGGAGRAFFAGS